MAKVKIPSEIQEMLNKMQNMSEDVQKKLSEVYAKKGESKESIDAYFDNPGNFTKAQWERLESIKESMREKVYTLVGKKRLKKIEDEKKKLKMNKNRKGKTLGGRKGWLPMR